MVDEPKIPSIPLGKIGDASLGEGAISAETANQAFLRRAKEQIAAGVKRGVSGFIAGLSGEGGAATAPGMLGPATQDYTLKGTSEVAEDLTRVRPREQLGRLPNLERVPDLRFSFTKIRTELGPGVDRVLQKSQDEVVSSIKQTYDVLKDRVYVMQKSLTILDRNVRVIDTRAKSFETEAQSRLGKLQSELDRMRQGQERQEQKFLKIPGAAPEKREDVTRAGGSGLGDFGGLAFLAKSLVPFLGPALAVAGFVLVGKKLYDFLESYMNDAGGSVVEAKKHLRADIDEAITKKFPGAADTLKKLKEIDEKQRAQEQKLLELDKERKEKAKTPGEWWGDDAMGRALNWLLMEAPNLSLPGLPQRLNQAPPKWNIPPGKGPTTLGQDLWSLAGGTAQAAERPPMAGQGQITVLPPGGGKPPGGYGGPSQAGPGGGSGYGGPGSGGPGGGGGYGGTSAAGRSPAMAAYGLSPRGGAPREPSGEEMGAYLRSRVGTYTPQPTMEEQLGPPPLYLPPDDVLGGTQAGVAIAREAILRRGQGTMYGQGAPGIPERPGAFGFIGGDIAAAIKGVGMGASAITGGGTAMGAAMGGGAAVGGAPSYRGGGAAPAGGTGRGGGAPTGGGPARPRAASGNLAQNQQIAYQTLRGEGMSDSAARIFVANLSGEGLGVPSDHHWDVKHMSGGIAQWDPARAARIKEKFGDVPWNLDVATQAKAAHWEMKTHYPDTYASLTNEKLSDQDRMFNVVKNWERPADPGGGTRTRLGYLAGLKVGEAATTAPGAAPAAPAAPGAPGGTSMNQVDEYLYQKFLKGDSSACSKAQRGADREGMSLKEYAIGGVDPKVKVNMFTAGQAMDKQGIDWHINGAYRSDWQQGIATGSMVGKPGYSRHGGSISTGGYGKGQAFDIGGEGAFEFIEASGSDFGLSHPYPKGDRPHVGPTGMGEMAKHRPGAYAPEAYEKITSGQMAGLETAAPQQVAQAPEGPVDLRVAGPKAPAGAGTDWLRPPEVAAMGPGGVAQPKAATSSAEGAKREEQFVGPKQGWSQVPDPSDPSKTIWVPPSSTEAPEGQVKVRPGSSAQLGTGAGVEKRFDVAGAAEAPAGGPTLASLGGVGPGGLGGVPRGLGRSSLVQQASYSPDIGAVSAQYEGARAGGIGAVSTGKGDEGGISYGEHQLSTKSGMPGFLASPEGAPYAQYFEGLKVGSDKFNSTYKVVAKQFGKEFGKAQKDYLGRTHYEPVEAHAKKWGYDTENPKVREALYSMAIQHGKAKMIVSNAGQAQGTPEEQVKQLFAARRDYVSGAKVNRPDIARNRYPAEEKDILAMKGQAAAPAGAPQWSPTPPRFELTAKTPELKAQGLEAVTPVGARGEVGGRAGAPGAETAITPVSARGEVGAGAAGPEAAAAVIPVAAKGEVGGMKAPAGVSGGVQATVKAETGGAGAPPAAAATATPLTASVKAATGGAGPSPAAAATATPITAKAATGGTGAPPSAAAKAIATPVTAAAATGGVAHGEAATQVKLEQPLPRAPGMAAHGISPHSAKPSDAKLALPHPGITTRLTPSLPGEKAAPAPKQGEKKESVVKKKETGSRQDAPQKPRESASPPKENRKARSEDRPPIGGDQGSGSGGGGSNPDYCHFCDP